MWRPLSPPQIHQKIIWTFSNFHKTTAEHWWGTPGTQEGSPISLKGGRVKYKRRNQREKIEELRSFLGRESWRRSFYTIENHLTGVSVGSFGISEGNIMGKLKNKKQNNLQTMCLATTASREVAQKLHVHQQWVGAGQGVMACIARLLVLRVRTGLNALRTIWGS